MADLGSYVERHLGDRDVDVVVVGSGAAGLTAALTAADAGLDVLVIEKEETVGGSTAVSGGGIWIPCNPLLAEAGIVDTTERAREYFDAVVGDAGGAASPERRSRYLAAGPEMVSFLRGKGLRLRRSDNYTDYHPELPGSMPIGRSLEPEHFDTRSLGTAEELLPRRSGVGRLPIQGVDVPYVSIMGRTPKSVKVTATIVARAALGQLRGRNIVAAGAALAAGLVRLCLEAGVVIAPATALEELTIEAGRVTGIVARREGEAVRLGARLGVVLAAGGFAKNQAMREANGPLPVSTDWSAVPAGDTGDAIRIAAASGAATEGLDSCWWVPAAITPEGQAQLLLAERSKPHCLIVDSASQRYVNESAPYVPFTKTMYAHHREVPAVPSWFLMDVRHRRRYSWGVTPPGWVPRRWLQSGYFRSADTITGLAQGCGLDPAALAATVERFNRFATIGRDEDFRKGESIYDRYYGDPRSRPNPCLGTVAEPPFYAVEIVPGDGGTAGGLVTDTEARVLAEDGSPIPGLYGCGNTTASVVGNTYPGPGATLGPAMVWGFVSGRALASEGQLNQA